MYLNNLANLLKRTRRIEEAERAYRDALKAGTSALQELPRERDHETMVAGLHHNLGHLLLDTARPEEAEKEFRRALELSQKLADDFPAVPRHRFELATQQNSLAGCLWKTGRASQAEPLFTRARELYKKLADDFPRIPDYPNRLGGTLHNLGLLLQDQNLKSEPGKSKYRLFLRNHYKNLGKALRRLGQLDRAEEALRQTIAIGEALVKDFPGQRDYRVNLADDYLGLGDLLRDSQAREQEEAYRHALALWQALADESPKVAVYRSQLATVLHNLAILLARQGEVRKARPLLEASIPHERAAYDAEPDKYREKLLQHYRMFLQAVLQLGDHAAAAKRAPEMVPVSGGDWKPCYQAAGYLQRCLSLVAKDAQLTADRRAELTQTYSRQYWGLLAESAKRGPDQPGVQRSLAVFLTTCPEPKYRDAARAVELASKAVKHDPMRGGYWAVLGMAQYRAGNWQEAITAIEKARELKQGKDTLFFLAMAYWRQGEKKLAHQRYDEALQWMQQHAPNNPRVRSCRDEAATLMGLKKE
jgi:tetratricopeptide (TPR) repeat protein